VTETVPVRKFNTQLLFASPHSTVKHRGNFGGTKAKLLSGSFLPASSGARVLCHPEFPTMAEKFFESLWQLKGEIKIRIFEGAMFLPIPLKIYPLGGVFL